MELYLAFFKFFISLTKKESFKEQIRNKSSNGQTLEHGDKNQRLIS